MRAGRMRHYMTFEALTNDMDSDGATVETWADVFGYPIATEVQPLSGRELMAAQATQSEVSFRLVVRYREGFRAAQRAVDASLNIYNIHAVIPDPDSGRQYITLLASRGLNDG